MSKILIDTNLLLDDPNILFKLNKEYDTLVFSTVVLKELDKHKNNPDLAYSARQAISAIKEFQTSNPSSVEFISNEEDLSSNDSLIIKAAKESGATLATKDISMSIIAKSKNVETKLYGNVANGIYKPYLYVNGSELNFNFTYLQVYEGVEYDDVLSKFELVERQSPDSWFFIFIETIRQAPIVVYANNPLTHKLERIDNMDCYRYIKNDKMRFKARDIYQMCAIYAMKNADNVLITGKWGSGKSLLTTAYAVSTNTKKSFISRPPLGIDPRYSIGFLPGSSKEKLTPWAMGFLSALYFLFGNTKGHAKDGKTFDFVKNELFDMVFELIDANSLQGLSLLDDFLLVDEVQLCTVDLISMIMSRATKDSKILMTGDLNQAYTNVKPSNSGLLKLLRVMPHKSMAYVELKHSYRSDLLELADKLQDKSF